MLSWQKDNEKICEAIKKNKQPAKAILKIKNDAYFLRKWADHHSRIFGRDGLIILDNDSTNIDMIDALQELAKDTSVFHFSGMHNLIHDVKKYMALYEAISHSADHYIFLDSDEFLYWANPDGSYLDDSKLIDSVRECEDKVLPGLWIENQPGYEDLLYFTPKQNRLISGLRGGKPMISKAHSPSGFMNHNCQLPGETYAFCNTANLIVAHLKNASPSQRMSTNIEKLRSYNLITKELEPIGIYGGDFTIQDIIGANHEALNRGNAKEYISEIKFLNDIDQHREGRSPSEMGAQFRNGLIEFASTETRSAVLDFLQSPRDFIQRALVEPPK